MSTTATTTLPDCLKALSVYPTILTIGDRPFFVSDYSGQLLTERVGFPGILFGDTENPNLCRGAFRSLNEMVSWLEEYKDKLDDDRWDAFRNWVDTWGHQIVFPLQTSRSFLTSFGGNMSLAEWDASNKHLPNPASIPVETDRAARAAAAAKKKQEQEERRREREEHPELAPFSISEYFRKHCNDGVRTFKVSHFTPLGVWEITTEEDPDVDPFPDLQHLIDEMGLVIPGVNKNPLPSPEEYMSDIPLSYKELTKGQKIKMKTFVDPELIQQKERKQATKRSGDSKKRIRSKAPKKIVAPPPNFATSE